jgi:hypothetical protein
VTISVHKNITFVVVVVLERVVTVAVVVIESGHAMVVAVSMWCWIVTMITRFCGFLVLNLGRLFRTLVDVRPNHVNYSGHQNEKLDYERVQIRRKGLQNRVHSVGVRTNVRMWLFENRLPNRFDNYNRTVGWPLDLWRFQLRQSYQVSGFSHYGEDPECEDRSEYVHKSEMRQTTTLVDDDVNVLKNEEEQKKSKGGKTGFECQLPGGGTLYVVRIGGCHEYDLVDQQQY